jgi:antitoxin VapB
MDVEVERIGDEIRIRPSRRSLGKVMSKFANFAEGFMEQGRGDNQEKERG